MGSVIAKALSESEVDKIYALIEANHKIFGLDVAMYVIAGMKGFQCIELDNVSIAFNMNLETRTHHLLSI